MSPTMIVGRVILPVIGLALAGLLVRQVVATGSVGLPVTSASDSDASPSQQPATESKASSAAAASKVVAEGRVVAYPGAEVVVGAEVAGKILAMPAGETSAVRKGTLLAEFRSDDAEAAVREAHARLAEADTALAQATLESQRRQAFQSRLAGTVLERDRVDHELGIARARRNAAKAAADHAEVLKGRCRVLAPIDGVVVARHANPGEIVNLGAPLVTIVDLSRLRVEAEVDESDIARCTLGAKATLSAEAFPGQSWKAEVEEIPVALTGREIRPEDPSRPTDLGVLRVKVAPREANSLKLGQRVDVEIFTGGDH